MFEIDEYGNLVPMGGRGFSSAGNPNVGSYLGSNVSNRPGTLNQQYSANPNGMMGQLFNPPPQTMNSLNMAQGSNAPMNYGAAQSYLAQQQLPNAITGPYAPVSQQPLVYAPQQPLGFGAAEYKPQAPAPAAPTSGSFFPKFSLTSPQTVGGALGGAKTVVDAIKPLAGVAAKSNPYLAAGTLAVGALSTLGGLYGLSKTKKPKPYSLDPKIQGAIGESESAARYGLSDTQLAAARQSQSQNVNSAMYNARNTSAGSGSRAVFGALQGMNMNAGNNLAMSDFNAQQGKIRYRDQMYGQMQTIRDRNTAQDIDTYNRKQQAYGGALQSGLTNMSSYFNLGQAMRYNPTSTT